MSMSALVTGGAGFLGSHLIGRLLARGIAVTCLDNLWTGRARNLDALRGHPGLRIVTADVREPLPRDPYDQIWNLASPASPGHYQADPVGTLMTNVLGMHNVLDLAASCGARVFQASTSEVYGDPDIHPQPESYLGRVNTTGPRACYDEGKRAAEALCFDFQRKHGVDVRVARIFNTYGPGMARDDGRVISNFIVRALEGRPLEIYGTGSQSRSFCYRDDLVAGFLMLMDRDAAPPGPVNLGNPGEFTMLQLAERVIALTGSRSPIVHAPLPADDPRQRRPDIGLAQRLLGWSPSIALEEGLKRTIAYFEAEYQLGPA